MGRRLLDQGRVSGGVYDGNGFRNQEVRLTGKVSTAKTAVNSCESTSSLRPVELACNHLRAGESFNFWSEATSPEPSTSARAAETYLLRERSCTSGSKDRSAQYLADGR